MLLEAVVEGAVAAASQVHKVGQHSALPTAPTGLQQAQLRLFLLAADEAAAGPAKAAAGHWPTKT